MSGSFSWSQPNDHKSTHSVSGKQVDVAKQTVPISDQLQRVYSAWDPQSPQCAFQHYFYNRVPPELAPQYVMPPGQDPRKWEKAMLARPDPASVPVLAIGFTDLQKRSSLQNQQVNAYRVRLHEINDKLAELKNRHDLHTTVKLLEMRERHLKLAHRALKLAVRIQVLSNRGTLLTPQEELLQRKTKDIIQKADDPAVFGSLGEAWARVKALKQQLPANEAEGNGEQADCLDWERDAEQLEAIVRILSDQQKGITFLAKTLAEDKQLINEELGLVPRKPKQKTIAASAVAPQAFAADVPVQNLNIVQGQGVPGQTGQGVQNTNTAAPQLGGGLGGGLFNQQSSNNNTLGGSLFGPGQSTATTNTTTTTNTGSTGGGLFGTQNQTQPQPSGGLFSSQNNTGGFGQSTTQPASGGLFGQTNQSTTTGGFGQTNQTSGGLFGANKPATGGLFGSTQPASTGFGQSNQTTTTTGFGQTPSSTTTTTGFGQTQPQSSGFGQSGGLFGQTNQNQTTTTNTGFGQPASTGFGQQKPATGGLFGQTQPAGGLGQPAATGFGQTNQPTTTGFGQPSQPTTGFGQPNQPAATGFGQPAATPAFGQTNNNNAFGQSTFGQKPGGLFGLNK